MCVCCAGSEWFERTERRLPPPLREQTVSVISAYDFFKDKTEVSAFCRGVFSTPFPARSVLTGRG